MSNSHISNLIGKQVRVNRGGPESNEGLLLAVKSNYIVLFIKHKGVIYYNLEHIKSITLLNKSTKSSNKHGQHREILLKYKSPPTFLDALRLKTKRLIKINAGGPDSVTGVLTHVHRDFIKLYENEELVIIYTDHIKSFIPSIRFDNHKKNDKK